MRAEIYRLPMFRSWFWKIRLDYSSLEGCAGTRWGAERQARRAWKRYTRTQDRYEIELDGEQA